MAYPRVFVSASRSVLVTFLQVVVVATGLWGCGQLLEDRQSLLACGGPARHGLEISLRDSTGYPIPDATIIAKDGEYAETLDSNGLGSYSGAVERVGNYTLLISAPGYSDTEIGPIVVEYADSERCHVRTQRRSLEFFP